MQRHWASAIQLIPWFALVLLMVALVLLMTAPTRRSLLALRLLAGVVTAIAMVGVIQHVSENYHAGPLDHRYAATWATMSVVSRLWAAATNSVGPAPPLAPGVLARRHWSCWSPRCGILRRVGWRLSNRPPCRPRPRHERSRHRRSGPEEDCRRR
jgi:hypothetical protein